MSLADLPLPYTLERTRRGPVRITGFDQNALHLSGRCNDERPAQGFADKIAALSDEDFVTEAEQCIWLSAYAANNPTSDYHFEASACYYEAQRRGNPGLYQEAYNRARGTI